MPVRLTYTLTGADAVGRDLAAIEQRGRDMSRPIGETLLRVVRRTARELHAGEHGIQSRHGTAGLAGSLTFEAGPLAGSIGSNKAYAAQLQFGGTILPKKGEYLTIPIGANVGAKGDPKFLSPLDVSKEDGGFFFTSKKGNLLFARRKPGVKARKFKGGTNERGKRLSDRLNIMLRMVELLFVLKRSVTQRAHNYVYWSEPGDTNVWNRVARNWLLRGK